MPGIFRTGADKITKEDLVAAGLDPDEIKTSLKTVKDGSATKEDLVNVTNALTAIQDSFKALEGKLNSSNDDKDKNKNKNNNNNEEDKPDEFQEYLADPVAFVNKKTGTVVAAAAIEFKRQSRDMAYREASRTMRGFKNTALKEEIEAEWAKYTPEKMAQFNTDPERCIKEIHDLIIGKHHDEIVQDTNKRDGKYNLVHSGAGSGGGNQGAISHTNNENKVELTETEKIQARKFGMTDEEWIKQGEDMEKEEDERRRGTLVGSK